MIKTNSQLKKQYFSEVEFTLINDYSYLPIQNTIQINLVTDTRRIKYRVYFKSGNMFNGSVLSVIMIATAPTGTLISSDAIVYRGTDETAIEIIIKHHKNVGLQK